MAPAGSAQASNAQVEDAHSREPSMEEILASIRRIIEDSDTGRRPAEPANFSAPSPTVIEEMAEVHPEPADVEAFRSGLVQDDVPAEHDVALEPEADEPAPAFDTGGGLSVASYAREDAAQPRREDSRFAPAPAQEAPRFHAAEPVRQPAEPVRHANAAEAVHHVPQSEPLRHAPQAERQSIISEQAGRQVAAAFSDLSDAFAASRKRGFDEIAEEMMRPMLQDWMDNNLPLLVERLVREEIERVARGAA